MLSHILVVEPIFRMRPTKNEDWLAVCKGCGCRPAYFEHGLIDGREFQHFCTLKCWERVHPVTLWERLRAFFNPRGER